MSQADNDRADWARSNPLLPLLDQPLGKLLTGVNRAVFGKRPRTVGLRELQRDMSGTLNRSRAENEYVVLTNRGAPSFLLIPIDPHAWTSLLAVPAPADSEFELSSARKHLEHGDDLPDTDAVLGSSQRR